MKIFVDIDETICHYKDVDRLGFSKIDYFDLTKKQIEKWGCKYHYLSVGEKPTYDLLICDKTKRIEEI